MQDAKQSGSRTIALALFVACGLAQCTSAGGSRGADEPASDDEAGVSDSQSFVSCKLGEERALSCGTAGDTCCASLAVPGGSYYRTYDLDPDGDVIVSADGGPADEGDWATVNGFCLDKYLVTVGRFRRFVTALSLDAGPGGYAPPAGSGKHTYLNGGLGLTNSGEPGTYETGWLESDDENIAPTDDNLACEPPYDTWTSEPGAQESLPINCTNWYEAYAFCIWDGGFLPSEAEWEYAAAGGGGEDGQRKYPWGSAPPGASNQYAIYDCNYYAGAPRDGGSRACVGVANIAPVGSAPLGAAYWGQLDLAGELFEWNLDWYGPYSPCVDCARLTVTSFDTDYRINRGGLFNLSASLLVVPYRNSVDPTGRSAGIGFRCARSP